MPFLRDGRYLGAGEGHHTVGWYTRDGDKIGVDMDVTQHGIAVTIFGETKKHTEARIEGKLNKPGKIPGALHPAWAEKPDYATAHQTSGYTRVTAGYGQAGRCGLMAITAAPVGRYLLGRHVI